MKAGSKDEGLAVNDRLIFFDANLRSDQFVSLSLEHLVLVVCLVLCPDCRQS